MYAAHINASKSTRVVLDLDSTRLGTSFCILYLVDLLITKKMWINYTDTADERINVSNSSECNRLSQLDCLLLFLVINLIFFGRVSYSVFVETVTVRLGLHYSSQFITSLHRFAS